MRLATGFTQIKFILDLKCGIHPVVLILITECIHLDTKASIFQGMMFNSNRKKWMNLQLASIITAASCIVLIYNPIQAWPMFMQLRIYAKVAIFLSSTTVKKTW